MIMNGGLIYSSYRLKGEHVKMAPMINVRETFPDS